LEDALEKHELMDLLKPMKTVLEQKHNVRVEFRFSKDGWDDQWPAVVIDALKAEVGWATVFLIKSTDRSPTGADLFDDTEVDLVLKRLRGDSIWKDIQAQFDAKVVENERREAEGLVRWVQRLSYDDFAEQPRGSRNITVDLVMSDSLQASFRTLPVGALWPALSRFIPMLLAKWDEKSELIERANLTDEQIGLFLSYLAIDEIENKAYSRGSRDGMDEIKYGPRR
jgi:hypothetical protein